MNTTRARRFFLLFVLVASVILAAGCDDVVDDPTFRMWCGESLCAWKLESGSIRRAPTWHKQDHGVEFVETPTTISQVVTKSPRCLEFTTIADVASSAQMTIGLDFNNDGTIDREQQVAETGFRESKTEVTAPALYDGIRFVLSKKGTGRAVLAQMRVQSKDACGGPAVAMKDLPLGSPCALAEPSMCHSGVCCEGVCAECCREPRFLDIAPDGGRGEPEIVTCPDGGACIKRGVESSAFFTAVVPLQCDPGEGNRPAGAVCLADDDCTSGACEGASSVASVKPAIGAPDAAPCPAADFPDAGGQGCSFQRVREGHCR